MDTALRENNHIAFTFLQWFVTEQLEEVSSMDQLLKIVQRAGEGRLLLVEQYLAGYKSAVPSRTRKTMSSLISAANASAYSNNLPKYRRSVFKCS